MELELRTIDRGNDRAEVNVDDEVQLYTEALGCKLTVTVTHRDEDGYGGNLLEDPETPYLQKDDHVHFESRNILEVTTE